MRKFVRRFDKTSHRETVSNLGREFKEELIDTGIVNWNHISYRYCGRHFQGVSLSDVFQEYELLIADIVEVKPTKEQLTDLFNLSKQRKNTKFRFATPEEIKCFGVKAESNKYKDWIANHTPKILEEKEENLTKTKEKGRVYSISLF